MPTSGIARHAHNMHQFIYPKPQKLVQLTNSCAHCSAPIAKHLKFCNRSCSVLFNHKLRPAGSESRSKGNESRSLKLKKHYEKNYTAVKPCPICNKLFPGKNKTCSKKCSNISRNNTRSGKTWVARPTLAVGTIHPTYLYIKQHSITGLLYFGKTYKDPYKYNGSGPYWQNHYKKYGKEYIQTNQVFGPFTDAADISEFAIFFSEEFDIVASKNWANKTIENGLDGAEPGRVVTEDHKQKSRDTYRRNNPPYTAIKPCPICNKLFPGRNKTCSPICARSSSESHKIGRQRSESSKPKSSISMTGKTHDTSDATKIKISEAMYKSHARRKASITQ